MKLIDVIKDIDNIDQEAIIFQEDKDNPNSDIILSFAEDGDEGIKEEDGRKYYYLIEVFLAKEFVRISSFNCPGFLGRGQLPNGTGPEDSERCAWASKHMIVAAANRLKYWFT